MRDAESRFAESTQSFGVSRTPRRFSQDGRRRTLGIRGFLLAAALFLMAMAGSAEAAEIEYSTSFNGSDAIGASAPFEDFQMQQMDIDQATGQVLVGTTSTIYKFSSGGVAEPFIALAPNTAFPQSLNAFGDLAVDNSGGAGGAGEGEQGRIYAMPENGPVTAHKPNGEALAGNFPLSYASACGVAVAPDGTLWVANWTGSGKVEQFSPAGAPTGTSFEAGFPVCGLAIDSANNFYVVKEGGAVLKFNSAGTSLGEFDSDLSFGEAKDVAIDRSNDHVYVQHRRYIKEFDSSGTLIHTFGEPEGAYAGLQNGQGVAVNESTGFTYSTNNRTGITGVDVFGPNNAPEVETGTATGIDRTNATISGHVDPVGKGDVTDCYFKYGTTAGYAGMVPCTPSASPGSPLTSPTSVSANLSGLAASTTYHFRLFATNAQQTGNGEDQTFKTDEAVLLSTDPATDVETTNATLNGTINPEGFDVTYYFQYGRSTNYGAATAAPPGADLGTTASVNTPVSVAIDNLTPGQTYHYRVVAVNSTGTSYGQDQTLKTFELPSIESFTSAEVTANSAKIRAKINPRGFETTYHVEYGTTPEYGLTAPPVEGVLAAGSTPQDVEIPLSDLGGVTYHFRVVATSKWGTTRSEDQTLNFFPPAGCPNASVRQQTGSAYLPDCRAYELVSPGETQGVILVPFGTPAPYASNPPRFSYAGVFGGLPGTDPVNGINFDRYIATRSSTGWHSTYVGLRGFETVSAWWSIGDQALDTFIQFESGFVLGAGTPYQQVSLAPFAFDLEGPLGRWPDSVGTIPNADEVSGVFQPSPDFSHMAFSSNNVDFDPNEEGLTIAPGSAYDYNPATKTTTLISRYPNGEDIAQEPGNSNPGEYIEFPGAGETFPAEINPSVSTDGSHILMSTATGLGPSAPSHLYMAVDDVLTYDVSKGQGVSYVGMTRDGSKVFFTTSAKLTADDEDTSVDLYMWSEATDTVTRLSVGDAGFGNSDSCPSTWTSKCDVGVTVGSGGASTDYPIAHDAGDVYFYSPEELVGGAAAGARNLYVNRNGHVQLVAILNADEPLTRLQVADDGAHAAFVTRTKLTTFENAGFATMYSYDPENGRVVCVSCSPNGDLPTDDVEASGDGLFMSNDGRTFFSTRDALVPKDTNALIDVYEYVDGRPQLITAGTGAADTRNANAAVADTGLAGVSADGIDVYFATYDSLVAQDHNGQFLKIYDARTGGGFFAPPETPPCEAADECHGASSSVAGEALITSDGDLGSGGNATAPKKGKKHQGKHRRHRRHKKAPHRGHRGRGE